MSATTQAYCDVADILRDVTTATPRDEDRVTRFLDRVRALAEELIDARAELDEWRGQDPDVDKPSALNDKIQALEKERDEAEGERDQIRITLDASQAEELAFWKEEAASAREERELVRRDLAVMTKRYEEACRATPTRRKTK